MSPLLVSLVLLKQGCSPSNGEFTLDSNIPYEAFNLFTQVCKNKPGTAKVGAISKAQNLKGGPFELCETPAGCKKLKKIEGGTLWRHEKISEKFFK